MKNMDTYGVTFTPEKLKALREELAKHKSDDDVFEFEGHQFLVAYARYLAEYLTGLFMAAQIKGTKPEYLGESDDEE